MGLLFNLRNLFSGQIKEVSVNDIEKQIIANVDVERYQALVAEEFMVNVGINMIANAISKCEFRTYVNGEEVFGNEYYAWNYEPNSNQNSSEFIHEIIYKLLYNGKVLVCEVAGQMMIADSFSEGTEVIKERTFTNISRQGFTLNTSRTMSEVMYFKLNDDSAVRLLAGICSGYNELMSSAIDKFFKSGGEKGILSVDAQRVLGEAKALNKTYDEVMEDIMNNRFKSFFNSKNAVLPLFNGYTYESNGGQESTKKSTSELKDVIDIDDKIVSKVANALNIPLPLLKGDIADVEKVTQNWLTIGIDPICNMMQGEINRKRSKKAVLQNTGVKIDTASILHIDLFAIADKIYNLVGSGTYCVDDIRRRCGDMPLNTEYSQQYFITKNNQMMEGGEEGDA